MIYLENSPPEKSKEFRYKSMFIKKSQVLFTIDAKGKFHIKINLRIIIIDFETFNAELVMETHTLGILYHLKGCEEIRSLSSVSELLTLPKIKAAFTSYKTAASIFDYITTELLKNLKWQHKTVLIPEMTMIVNEVMSRMCQTHALMAVFEKTLNDRADIEVLAKSGITQT